MIMRLFQSNRLCAVILAVLWWLAAVGQIEKYFGQGVSILALVVIVAIALLYAWKLPSIEGWWSRALGMLKPQQIAIVFAVLVLVLFAVLFPISQEHLSGVGTDRADALNRAVSAILAGHSPYSTVSYLGRPIALLPGAFLLAIPFKIIWTSALQNPFWLVAFLLCIKRWLPNSLLATAFIVFMLSNLGILQDYVVGNDYLINVIIVLFAMEFALHAFDGQKSGGLRALAIICLAVALSIRPTYIVILPILFFHFWKQDKTAALILALGTGVLLLAINLPLYLHDPAHFGPLAIVSKASSIPGAVWILPVIALASTCLVLISPSDRKSLFAIAALALAIMILPPVIVQSIESGLGFYTAYTMAIMMFFGLALFPTSRRGA